METICALLKKAVPCLTTWCSLAVSRSGGPLFVCSLIVAALKPAAQAMVLRTGGALKGEERCGQPKCRIQYQDPKVLCISKVKCWFVGSPLCVCWGVLMTELAPFPASGGRFAFVKSLFGCELFGSVCGLAPAGPHTSMARKCPSYYRREREREKERLLRNLRKGSPPSRMPKQLKHVSGRMLVFCDYLCMPQPPIKAHQLCLGIWPLHGFAGGFVEIAWYQMPTTPHIII